MNRLEVQSREQTEFIDVTLRIQEIVAQSGVESGMCVVYVPHTTAGCTINEHADPDVARDMLMELNKIVPFEDGYRHGEGNSAAHIKATLVGSSHTILIERGRLALGTWQGIFFCEFDGPRMRHLLVQVMGNR
jgi:secondary thiamine-phosphate synthase enzyme